MLRRFNPWDLLNKILEAFCLYFITNYKEVSFYNYIILLQSSFKYLKNIFKIFYEKSKQKRIDVPVLIAYAVGVMVVGIVPADGVIPSGISA